jgi:hypothetical protein
MDTDSGGEGNDSGTGHPRTRKVRLKIQSLTQPRLELEARQGRRGGQDVRIMTCERARSILLYYGEITV